MDNAEFLRGVCCAAAGALRAAGVRAGDPVLLQLRNSAYAIADVGISALGGVLVPPKTSMAPTEMSGGATSALSQFVS